MATGEITRLQSLPARDEHLVDVSPRDVAMSVLHALASLKLTVALFALSIVLVFLGTLAQKDNDVWFVVEKYFHSWIVLVPFQTLERLLQVFFKGVAWNVPGVFPFPGGNFLGLLLIVNLLAAHAVRFKVAATGRRLIAGTVIMAAGVALTALVIFRGMDEGLESELSPAFCNVLWNVFRGGVALVALAGANLLWYARGRIRRVEWSVLLAVELVLAAAALFLLFRPDVRLDDAGLRIMWQLISGTNTGLVLLLGAALVFRKRAGIVVLHGGIGLMMGSVLWTAVSNQESQMAITEGQTTNVAVDSRSSELAVIDRSPAEHDRVTVIPPALLERNVGRTERIEHPDLPFSLQVHRWLPNARRRNASEAEPSPATAGGGRAYIVDEVARATGAKGDERDLPAAVVELFAKSNGRSLGTYLLSILLREQVVEVDGRPYEIALRFKEVSFPYSLTLEKFSFDRYPGTNTAKNFSSLVRLRDPARNVDRHVLIWMNNPLRYAGTTFYQSSFDEVTERTTYLQVMSNPSWMAPYVACMLVATGMLAHFGVMLFNFLVRRAATASAATTAGEWVFPSIVVAFAVLVLAVLARMPQSGPSEMQIDQFARLPVQYQGRIKPYDSLARNSLQFLSGKQSLTIEDSSGKKTRLPALLWLLDVISGKPDQSGNLKAGEYRIFRIENLDVLNTLGLEQRSGSWRYSWNEIYAKGDEFEKEIAAAGVEAEAELPLTLYQQKLLDLGTKIRVYSDLVASFRSPLSIMAPADLAQRSGELVPAARREFKTAPHSVPPQTPTIHWDPLIVAELQLVDDRMNNRPLNTAAFSLRGLLQAYAHNDVATFNRELAEYQRQLAAHERLLADHRAELLADQAKAAEIYTQGRPRFEVFFNHFSPFIWSAWLYMAAFILGVASWLTWTVPLRRASMWLIWLTFLVHTFALIGRMYISGRPPVTNLYSSAVFIGWGVVLLAMVLESIYRLGLGNIVAAIGGFLTLLVAHFLSLDGDTMIVMQAVLDTQFWLATHVVCITLGYSTTYLAGLLGILYILLAHVFPALQEEQRRQLVRMMYGTLCFAILFSFVGTVLGGLWGDDSWGRFWGWDPKENGALIIVLWNALVLHARWGGLVKARGLAMLAVVGNIVVTWSWFGVNELGVGLHSYGASESSTAMWLLVFAGSQAAAVALGAMPRHWFAALGGPHSSAAA
jgi:ABC-type transport system involved in cytochrome c biogenesis permease subunit